MFLWLMAFYFPTAPLSLPEDVGFGPCAFTITPSRCLTCEKLSWYRFVARFFHFSALCARTSGSRIAFAFSESM